MCQITIGCSFFLLIFAFKFDYLLWVVSRQRNRVKSVVLLKKKKRHRFCFCFCFRFLPWKGVVFTVGLFPNLSIYCLASSELCYTSCHSWVGRKPERQIKGKEDPITLACTQNDKLSAELALTQHQQPI